MTATFDQAYDEMLALFKTVWDAESLTAEYPNVEFDKPSPPTAWARVSVQHATGRQDTLAGDGGVRRYTRTGSLFVQIFVGLGDGLSEAYRLSKVVADAFDGAATASAVWFRGVRINEVGSDGSWYQINVVADFTYDEVK